MIPQKITFLIWTPAFLWLALAGCSEPAAPATFYEELVSAQVEQVRLEADFSNIPEKDPEVANARLVMPDGSVRQASLSIRGKTRKQLCEIPPLKIRFDDTDTLTYKVVTPCFWDERGARYLFREYLAYQLYRELADASFGAHLMQMEWVDTSSGKSQMVWAMVLEPKELLAKRLNAEGVGKRDSLRHIHAGAYAEMVVFQYMIGNTDWNLEERHNIRWFRSKADGVPFPVAYDFDFSGLVNAGYAKPHTMLPIQTVTQRYFQWRGKDRAILKPVLARFELKKGRLLEIIRAFPHLNDAEKGEMIDYLEGFFRHIHQLEQADFRGA